MMAVVHGPSESSESETFTISKYSPSLAVGIGRVDRVPPRPQRVPRPRCAGKFVCAAGMMG